MTTEFFKKRKAPAAFKHAILSRYPIVFAGKLGSTSVGNRVVFLDGYAGRGRYEDGEPGSPLLLARSGDHLKHNRQVQGFFVERDPDNAAALKAALEQSGTAMRYEVMPGDLDDRLDDILQRCGTAPVFAFLDPFGTALNYDRLRDKLLRRRPGVTEVLLHFTAIGVARMGGILRKARERNLSNTEEKQIARVDHFLGGRWWRQYFTAVADTDSVSEERATEVAIRISEKFTSIVQKETGYRAVTMPIRPRPDRLPKYVLALFTKNSEGLWCFASTLGGASKDWHAAWLTEEEDRRLERDGDQGVLDLFADPSWRWDSQAYEKREAADWVSAIEGNICQLLDRGRFRLADQTIAVYGKTLGVAWDKHVRQALKNLYKRGLVENSGVGPYFYREELMPTKH